MQISGADTQEKFVEWSRIQVFESQCYGEPIYQIIYSHLLCSILWNNLCENCDDNFYVQVEYCQRYSVGANKYRIKKTLTHAV